MLTVNVFATVPRAPEQPAMGEPADDVLSTNVPDTFPGSLASCSVYGSAAFSSSTANDLSAADAGKQTLSVFLRPCTCVSGLYLRVHSWVVETAV